MLLQHRLFDVCESVVFQALADVTRHDPLIVVAGSEVNSPIESPPVAHKWRCVEFDEFKNEAPFAEADVCNRRVAFKKRLDFRQEFRAFFGFYELLFDSHFRSLRGLV